MKKNEKEYKLSTDKQAEYFEAAGKRVAKIIDLIFLEWNLSGYESLEIIGALLISVYRLSSPETRQIINSTVIPDIIEIFKKIDNVSISQ